jgi:branched-chain amino acid transport system permease protein
MSLTLQVLLSGIAAGAVYGVVAIGHTIVFRLTGIVHFAFGDLIGVGVFTSLAVAVGTAPATQAGLGGGRFALALVAAVAVCLAAGVATYLLVIEPFLARGSVLGWIGGVVAVALAAQALVNSIFSRPSYVFPDPLPFRHVGTAGVVHLGSATFQIRSVFVIGVGVVLAAAAGWTLRTTRFGRALTAIAQDPEAARVVGLPVKRLTAIAFGVVGALAAVLAIVAAPGAPFGTQSGAVYGLKGLAAAVVVGFAGPWRSFAAGIALGVAEAAAGGLEIGGGSLGPAYREVLPLAVVILLLAAGLVRDVVEERE